MPSEKNKTTAFSTGVWSVAIISAAQKVEHYEIAYYGTLRTLADTLLTQVAPFFEVFAGVFELIATLLILFRRTATLGALMMIAILLPIWFVNIGYDAWVELASLHLLFLSAALLVKDAGNFYAILIRHKEAAIGYIQLPNFSKQWKKSARIVLKARFIFLFLFTGDIIMVNFMPWVKLLNSHLIMVCKALPGFTRRVSLGLIINCCHIRRVIPCVGKTWYLIEQRPQR